MPTRQEREAVVLTELGYDPSKYEITADHHIVFRANPPEASQTSGGAPTEEDNSGKVFGLDLPTVGRSALRSVPSLIGGGVGGGLGAAGGTAVAPFTGPAAPAMPFIGGVGGAIAGSGVGEAVEGQIEKHFPAYGEFVNKGRAENPWSAEIGALAPMLAAGNPIRSLKTIRDLFHAAPTFKRFTPTQLGHLANVGVGAGMGTGSAIAEDYSSPEGLNSGTAGKAALRTLAGVLGSQPNKFGRLLSGGGLKDIPETPDPLARAPRGAATAMRSSAEAPFADAEVMPMAGETDAAFNKQRLLEGGRKGLPAPTIEAEIVPETPTETPASPVEPPVDSSTPPKVEPQFAREDVLDRPDPQDPGFRLKSQQKALPDVPVEPPTSTEPMSDAEFAKQKRSARHYGYPLEREQSGTLLGQTTKEWDDLIRDVAAEHYGADVESGGTVTGAEGRPVAGKVKLPANLERALIQIAKNAGIDTGPHEIFHLIIHDVLTNGKPAEKRFVHKALAATKHLNRPGDYPEEWLAQEGGQEFVKRLMGENEGKGGNLLGDLTAFVRSRFLNRGTPADFRRLAANTLRYGAGAEQYRPGSTGAVKPVAAPPKMEDEKRPKKPSVREQPLPESAETLREQIRVMQDPASTRKAVLFVPDAPKVETPVGLKSVKTPHGTVVYNPAKVDEASVVKAGAGEQFDARLLGMSQTEKPVTGDKVVTTSKEGVPDVLTEAVRDADIPDVVEEHKAGVPGGETEVKPATDVLEERASSREQPLGPTEVYGKDQDRPKRTYDILMGPLRRLEKSTDVRRQYAGDVFRRLFSKRDAYRGKYSGVLYDIAANKKSAREALDAMIERDRTGVAPGPFSDPKVQKVYDSMSDTLEQMRVDQIAADHRGVGGRMPGMDPTYMFNQPARETMRTLVTQQDSPRWKQLKEDFINHNMARGMTQAEAERGFKDYIDGVRHQQSASSAVDFGPVSLPENTKLPDSWINPDPFDSFERYINNYTRARAWHDVVTADAGASRLFEGDTSLIKDPDVVEAFNSFSENQPSGMPPMAGSIVRLINSVLLGPKTRIADIMTTPFKALGHTRVKDIPGLVATLADFGKSYRDSRAGGLNKAGGNLVNRELLGAHEAVENALDRGSKALATSQGGEAIEIGARTIAQGFGNYLAGVYRADALVGDKSAAQFLSNFGSDWRTVPIEELGTRIARLFQGNNDARNLPKMATEGKLAPFLSLAKWSIEQWNNFRQFGIEPFRKGDPAPLMRMIVAHLLGGAAVLEMQHLFSNKKPYIADIEEIKNAPDKNKQVQESAVKIGAFLQATGLLGLWGDLMNSGMRAVTGRFASGPTFPAGEVAVDTVHRGFKAATAIAQGVPMDAVLKQMISDISRKNIQVRQLLLRDSTETDEANKTRDYRMFRKLSGYNDQVPVANVDYSRAEEREFDKEKSLPEAKKLADSLVTRAAQRYGNDPYRYRAELDKLRLNRIPWMPQNPREQEAYRAFIVKTQGEEKARSLFKDYERAQGLQQEKRAMVVPK